MFQKSVRHLSSSSTATFVNKLSAFLFATSNNSKEISELSALLEGTSLQAAFIETRLSFAHTDDHYLSLSERQSLADKGFLILQDAKITPYIRLYSMEYAKREMETKGIV
ncbi:hypothetical protein WA171_005255 [Blastocystis sp. BT1]